MQVWGRQNPLDSKLADAKAQLSRRGIIYCFARSCETLIHSGAIIIFDLGPRCGSLAQSLKLFGFLKRSCKSLTNSLHTPQTLYNAQMGVLAKPCCEHMGWKKSLLLDENEATECGRERTQEKMGYLRCDNSSFGTSVIPRSFGACCMLYSTLDMLLFYSKTLKTSQVSDSLCAFAEN